MGETASTTATEHQPNRSTAQMASEPGQVVSRALTDMQVMVVVVPGQPPLRVNRMGLYIAVEQHDFQGRGGERVEATSNEVADLAHVAERRGVDDDDHAIAVAHRLRHLRLPIVTEDHDEFGRSDGGNGGVAERTENGGVQ